MQVFRLALYVLFASGFVLNAACSKKENTRSSIIVIGDSIALGEGAQGTDHDCALDEKSNSLESSFASLIAKQRDADLTLLAWSGRGLVHNFGGFDAPTVSDLLQRPDIQARLDATENVDLIIISLGTNDFYQFDASEPFVSHYQEMIDFLGTKFADANIVALNGPMLSGDDSERLKNAVARATANARLTTKNRIKHVDMSSLATSPKDFACQWHPSSKLHERMAETILKQPL